MQAATGFHNPLLACPHLAFSCSLLQFAGTGYLAGDGAGCRYCGTCQIDLGFYMSHTSDKVTIGRGDTSLAFCQDTHVSTKAGSTGRSAYDCSRFNKGLQKSLFHGLHIDGLGGRNYDAAHAFRHMSALEYLCCGAQIVNTSVGAGTDDYLVDGNGVHLVDLIDGMCILRQMREGHGRP